MKKIIFAISLMLGLAACGGGNARDTLVKACLDDGDTPKATCECMGDSAVENLDKPLLNKLVAAAKKGEEASEEMMKDLTAEETGQFMTFAMSAAMKCSMAQ